jgi:sugar phosphate isomerase/epimerase
MLRAVSTYVYVNQRLHPGLLDGLARAGAEGIELFGARGHFNYHDRAHVRELAGWFKDHPQVQLHSVHAPLYADAWGPHMSEGVNFVDPDKRRRIAALDEIKRSIEVAEDLPFKFLVQHIGMSNTDYEEAQFEHALSAIEHLRAFARPLGVSVLVENIPNGISTPEKLRELVKMLRYDDLGYCFDTGHAHMVDGIRASFEVMKDRIRSTHVHDNPGNEDIHLWPGDGTTDWQDTMELLRSAPSVPPLLLEINGDGKENAEVLSGIQKTFEKLNHS